MGEGGAEGRVGAVSVSGKKTMGSRHGEETGRGAQGNRGRCLEQETDTITNSQEPGRSLIETTFL